ncbi:hypothetical protein GCM10010468_22670 [Actinocorallia longicatena]|uniref:Uncharacterized protein n=1 Tax=Actinocorallia longicatena TaxID=111803 RepID=A0ABP6Q702_9ACTN
MRTREYLATKACLLTGAQGITDPAAIPAWSGMQQASLRTRAKVQYLPVTGPATVANSTPFLNTLIASGCAVIVAAGDIPAKTVSAQASLHPSQAFVLIGSTAGHPNITAVNGEDRDISARVEALVSAEVSGKE